MRWRLTSSWAECPLVGALPSGIAPQRSLAKKGSGQKYQIIQLITNLTKMKETINTKTIPESCLASVSGSSNRVLKLTLKKQWFDMILSGEKKEEYREFKDYWINRLTEDKSYCQMGNNGYVINEKKYDWVEFTNGYNKNSPRVTLQCKGIEISTGNTEWGAVQNESYFVIKLGYEIARMNCH